MAWNWISYRKVYTCLSTDTKVTSSVKQGEVLEELDSGKIYKFNGIDWEFWGYGDNASSLVEITEATPLRAKLEVNDLNVAIGDVEIQLAGTDVSNANPFPVEVIGIESGSNIIGKVGIDQTTDGTTNKVQARNSTHDNFQANANLQVADADVSNANPVPVSDAGGSITVDQSTHDNFNTNANLQINDTDVSNANPVPVSSAAGEVSVSMTRPDNTTAYVANNVVGTNPATVLEFATGLKAGCDFLVQSASLTVHANAVPTGMGQFRLHLYNAAPTPIADGTAFNLIAADRSKYLGSVLIGTPERFGDTLYSQVDNIGRKRKLASGSSTLYGQLVTLEGFPPSASTVKTLGVGVIQV
jgi:hypothetical protein